MRQGGRKGQREIGEGEQEKGEEGRRAKRKGEEGEEREIENVRRALSFQ